MSALRSRTGRSIGTRASSAGSLLRPVRAVAGGLFVLAVLVPAVGCGGGSGSSPRGRDGGTSAPSEAPVVTPEQASRFADVLVKNRDAGTASVEAEYRGPDGVVSLKGAVDWVQVRGRFSISFPPAPNQLAPTEVAYTATSVFQHLPQLGDAFAARGYPGAEWTVQAAGAGSSPLVLVFGLISGASAEQRDNPAQLVARGATFQGRRTEGAVEVEGFGLGKTTYWVGTDDGMLHRLDAELGDAAVTITFSAWGASPVRLPEDALLVDGKLVADILAPTSGVPPSGVATSGVPVSG